MKSLVVKDRNLRKLIKKQSKQLFLKNFLVKKGISSGISTSIIKTNNRCVVT